MMATVPHVTSGSGLRKFQADGFLLDRVYLIALNDEGSVRRRDSYVTTHNIHKRYIHASGCYANPQFQLASGRKPPC